MMRSISWFYGAALAVCMSLVSAHPGGAIFRQAPDSTLLDRILKSTVTDGRVDYPAIAASHAAELKAYLDWADDPTIDPKKWSRNEQLAFYINLYNATVIHTVVEKGPSAVSLVADDFALFKAGTVRLGGKTLSLNALENDIIRKQFADPRVHAALVCGARSCPPLRAGAWTAEDLDADLEAAMKAFIRDASRNRVDDPAKTLELSRIFDWYALDFGGAAEVPAYISRYLGRRVDGYTVSFLDYSWELNVAER